MEARLPVAALTIRGTYKKLLHLSASAREMLIEAAANKWSVNKSECYAENGFCHSINLQEKNWATESWWAEASKLTPPKDVKLKDAKDYKIIRKPMPRQAHPLKVNGKAIFGIDKKLPG